MDKLPKVLYTDLDTLSIKFGLPAVNYALPPEDPLNELSTGEMNLRKFCYKHNHEVFISLNEVQIKVYLDPDILMVMEDNLKNNLMEFKRNNKPLRVDLMESIELSIILTPEGELVHGVMKGDIENEFVVKKKDVSNELDKFLTSFYGLAHDTGYSLE